MPCFERVFPEKMMVLVADNAPYHHRQQIGNILSMKKSDLVKIIKKYKINYLDIPLTEERIEAYTTGKDTLDSGVTDMGQFFRVSSNFYDLRQRKYKNKPFLPTVDELRLGIVEFLKENNCKALLCEVELF